VDERSFRNPKLRNAGLIAYKAFADLAGKGSLFVITIAAARRLSPQAFGVFSLGSTLGWILAVVTDFGIQLHLAREVAKHPADARALLRSWLRLRLWTAAAAIGAVTIGTTAAGWAAPYSVPVAVFALVYACSGLIELLNYFYRGLSRSDLESSLTLWQRGATLVCGLAALAWRPDVTVLAVALLLPVVVTLGVSVRMALRLGADMQVRPREITGTRVRPDKQAPARADDAVAGADPGAGPSMTSVFRRDVWPIGAGIVLSALYFRIDVFLLQLWRGTEAVGLYNAVFRLVEALRLFPAAVMAVTLPAMCRATDLRPLARAAAPVTLGAVAAAAILWAAAGWLIPALYQARYEAAVPAFRILLLSFPLMALNMALTHQLIGWDAQRGYAALCAGALVVNVALNARLIPAVSIDGAAWATLGTELFLTAGGAIALSAVASKRGGAAVAESAVAG
jgi:O-antigen/teichoic acid export membrane protein